MATLHWPHNPPPALIWDMPEAGYGSMACEHGWMWAEGSIAEASLSSPEMSCSVLFSSSNCHFPLSFLPWSSGPSRSPVSLSPQTMKCPLWFSISGGGVGPSAMRLGVLGSSGSCYMCHAIVINMTISPCLLDVTPGRCPELPCPSSAWNLPLFKTPWVRAGTA